MIRTQYEKDIDTGRQPYHIKKSYEDCSGS